MASHRKAERLIEGDVIRFDNKSVLIKRMVLMGGTIGIDYETEEGEIGHWMVSSLQMIPLAEDDGVEEAEPLPMETMRPRTNGLPPLPALADEA